MGGSSTAEGSLGQSLWGHGWEGGGPGVSGCSSREGGTIWVIELVCHYFVYCRRVALLPMSSLCGLSTQNDCETVVRVGGG